MTDYYICIPMSYNKPMERGFENQDSSLQGLRICSLDSGVRTFQTVFDAPSSKVIHVVTQTWVVGKTKNSLYRCSFYDDLGHYRFRQRLIHKARQCGSKVVVVRIIYVKNLLILWFRQIEPRTFQSISL